MKKCYNCNNEAKHKHHIVPRSKGGVNTVDLCVDCHIKVHNKVLILKKKIKMQPKK